jgi:DNA polymerase-1
VSSGSAGSEQSGLFASETPPAERNGHTVVVIDGHALAFRSYYAIRELTTSQGRSVNAVFGFVRSLLRILGEEGEHDATVVAFDAPAKTFRHEQYEDYKAGRAPIPEDLPGQIDTIKRLVDLLGLHRIEVPGLEADDLMGTIATRCEARGYRVEIVTSDRDAYQLVSENVKVRGLDKRDQFGPEQVLEKYGVTVEQWTDYRALIGDASDNIPGAKGIGPVSARKLLQRYGTLDHILDNLDEVEPPKVADKVRASIDDVRFSRMLSEIVTDADITIAPEDWAQRELQGEPLAALLTELEFGAILRDLDLRRSVSFEEVRWERAPDGGAIGFRLSSERPFGAALDGWALAADGQVAVAPNAEALSGRGPIDAADAKALCVWARSRGIALRPGDDPLLMAYILDPNTAGAEAVARRYGAADWGEEPAERAQATAELLGILDPLLQGQQRRLYEDIERPLQGVLVDMEACGIAVDRTLLDRQSAELAERIGTFETQVRELAAEPLLNLNSRDQLATLLYDKLELRSGRKTSTGKRSTAVSVLEGLREEHEVVDLILGYRELTKLKSTYLDPLPRLIDPDTGRIHTTFNQTVAATGRLSSVNPNLQNIPVRTEVGREIRRAFVAGEGSVLVAADYSQIELRILAHIADESALIEAFARGEDVHTSTAAQVHGVGVDAVTPDMRRVAKVINFGVLYGMSAHRLTRELAIPYDEADAFIDTYFERYPAVRRYIDGTLDFCRANGYVETLLGRRRVIADIGSRNRNAREYAERAAYNMPIQGTAADIMKLAMLALAPELPAFDARLLLQVHDELIVEVPVERVEALLPRMHEVMEGAFELAVPLAVESGVGANWLEAK